MGLKINKSLINQINFFEFLHDKIIGNLVIENNSLIMSVWNTFESNVKPSHLISFKNEKNIDEYVNVYLYKIENGEIKGRISDLHNIAKAKIKFEIIDVGYMNSILFFKGSIINNGKMDRNIIVLEFNFDNIDFLMEIK